MHQRRQAEEQAGGHRHRDRKDQDDRIDAQFARAGQGGRIHANERLHAKPRHHQPERAAGDGQQQAFRHELTDQMPAPGAQGGAHGELTMARLGAREQQVREIGAGDQQDESDGRLQHPDRAAGAPDQLLPHRLHLQDVTCAGLGLGILAGSQRLEAMPLLQADTLSPVPQQRRELRLRLLRRDTVLQPADQIEEVTAPVGADAGVETERKPHLGPVVHHVGARRHDADHLARQAVHLDGLADHVAAAEGGLPELVRQDGVGRQRQRRRARARRRTDDHGLAAAEQAARGRLDTQGRQQVIVDVRRAHAPRPVSRGEVGFPGRERANRRERLVQLPELEVLRRRHPELIESERREPRRQIHQLLRLRVRQRPQDHAVDDGEDCRVGPDPEPERHHCDERVHRGPEQPSNGVAKVLAKVIGAHRGFDGNEGDNVEPLDEPRRIAPPPW